MAAAAPCAAPQPQRYQRRRPEQTLWYRIVQAHFATWLELASGPYGESPPLWAAAEPADNDPQWGASAQPAPEFEFDQRVAW